MLVTNFGQEQQRAMLDPKQLAKLCYCGHYWKGSCPRCPTHLSMLDRVNGVPINAGCCGN